MKIDDSVFDNVEEMDIFEDLSDEEKKEADFEAKLLMFAHWVAGEVINDDLWDINYYGFQEIACRKLTDLGIMTLNKDGYYVYDRRESQISSDDADGITYDTDLDGSDAVGSC